MPGPPTTCPRSDVDLWSAETLSDPYPTYRQLQDLGSVVWLERYELFALPRFDIVRSVLTNWKQFSSASGVGMQPLANDQVPPSIIKSDPPAHDDFRRPIAAQLSNSALAKDTATIQQIAERVVHGIVHMGRFDGVADLARPFSLDVVCDLAGIPPDCRAHLPHLAEQAFNLFGPDNELLALAPRALGRMWSEVIEFAKTNRYEPGRRAAELVAIDRPEQVLLYTWPGIDTTVNGISAALYLFAAHPDQWDLVRRDESLIPGAFAETLRMHAPVHYFTRLATEDVDVADVTIPANSRVLVMYGSANRDGRHYPDPDRFDVTRNPTDQLAFGRGIHLCVGANLAKLEGHVLLATLARRVKQFRFAETPQWLVNNTLHGLAALPLTIEPI